MISYFASNCQPFMKKFTTTLLKKKDIARNVVELQFSKPDELSFVAGQFFQFLIPSPQKETPRSYSAASIPNDSHLMFCVKLLENGLGSDHFRHMNVGDSIEIKGPLGRFILNDEAPKHTFVATGAGLAPILPMIRQELKINKSRKPINLLFGVRHDEDIFWQAELAQLSEEHPNFTTNICLSQPSETWTGTHGRVTEHLEPIDTDAHFYLCGSGQMVMEVRALIAQAGVKADQIHFEIF